MLQGSMHNWYYDYDDDDYYNYDYCYYYYYYCYYRFYCYIHAQFADQPNKCKCGLSGIHSRGSRDHDTASALKQRTIEAEAEAEQQTLLRLGSPYTYSEAYP